MKEMNFIWNKTFDNLMWKFDGAFTCKNKQTNNKPRCSFNPVHYINDPWIACSESYMIFEERLCVPVSKNISSIDCETFLQT